MGTDTHSVFVGTDAGHVLNYALKSKGHSKLRTRWGSGLWLGVRDESGETLIGTDDGVIRCRTVRRKGSDEERWSLTQVQNMKGTPWAPEPDIDSTDSRYEPD